MKKCKILVFVCLIIVPYSCLGWNMWSASFNEYTCICNYSRNIEFLVSQIFRQLKEQHSHIIPFCKHGVKKFHGNLFSLPLIPVKKKNLGNWARLFSLPHRKDSIWWAMEQHIYSLHTWVRITVPGVEIKRRPKAYTTEASIQCSYHARRSY